MFDDLINVLIIAAIIVVGIFVIGMIIARLYRRSSKEVSSEPASPARKW